MERFLGDYLRSRNEWSYCKLSFLSCKGGDEPYHERTHEKSKYWLSGFALVVIPLTDLGPQLEGRPQSIHPRASHDPRDQGSLN